MSQEWTVSFPGLGRLDPASERQLIEASKIVRLPAGTRVFGTGQTPQAYLLLIDGTVRVQQVSGSGREIVLYRVTAGQSCVLTTACLIGGEDYEAEAIAETDIVAAAIPRTTFDDLIGRSPAFRQFVFTAFSHRVTTLLRIIEEVAFSRIDARLAQRLLDIAQGKSEIGITHQELAAELGSAREVISRQLSEFQRRGWITLARGAIEIVDAKALRQLATTPAT